MRVLYMMPSLSGGGAERQLSYLSTALASQGHEVHCAYLYVGPDATVLTAYECAGVILHPLRRVFKFDPGMLIQLIELVRHVRPHVMQSCIAISDSLLSVLTKISGIPWIMREASWPTIQPTPRWQRWLRSRSARRASAIVANSRAGADYWASKHGHLNVRVIRNGFPIADIATKRQTQESCVHSSCRGDRFILYVGRLYGPKNVDGILTAMRHLCPELHLVICGIGPAESHIRGLISAFDLERRITMLGNVPREYVWSLMRQARALLLVSHHEGFPNVLVEAMLNRCPLVVSDIPPLREVLDDTTACFVNKDDPMDIAKGVCRILGDSDGAADRGEAAFRMARGFSVERMAGAYLDLYEEVLAASRTQTSNCSNSRSISITPTHREDTCGARERSRHTVN